MVDEGCFALCKALQKLEKWTVALKGNESAQTNASNKSESSGHEVK